MPPKHVFWGHPNIWHVLQKHKIARFFNKHYTWGFLTQKSISVPKTTPCYVLGAVSDPREFIRAKSQKFTTVHSPPLPSIAPQRPEPPNRAPVRIYSSTTTSHFHFSLSSYILLAYRTISWIFLLYPSYSILPGRISMQFCECCADITHF